MSFAQLSGNVVMTLLISYIIHSLALFFFLSFLYLSFHLLSKQKLV